MPSLRVLVAYFAGRLQRNHGPQGNIMNSEQSSRSNRDPFSGFDLASIGHRMSRLLAVTGAAASLLMLSSAFASTPGSGDSNSPDGSGCGGGCPSQDEQIGKNPVGSKEGEVKRDQGGCEQSGGGAQSTLEVKGQFTECCFTVAWDSGEKWEQENDLVVRVPGADYMLTREYTSDPARADNPYNIGASLPTCVDDSRLSANIGSGWGWSNLRGATGKANWVPGGAQRSFDLDSVDLTLYLPARSPKLLNGAPGGIISNYGPGNQNSGGTFATTSVANQDNAPSPCAYFPDAIYYEEPGRWRQTFDVSNGAGWILEDTDEYGNSRVYEDTDSDAQALPDVVWLNGTDATDSDAWIQLHWRDNRLVCAEVYRPTGGTPERTQSVQYYHLVEESSQLVVKFYDLFDSTYKSLSVTPHLDLGTEGDLVMVVRSELVDVDAPDGSQPNELSLRWRRQITQYRYHDDSAAPETGDIRVRIRGGEHQLKSVFKPQQVEFLAQQRSAASSPSDQTAIDEAIELLEIADDAPFDGASGSKMYEIAGKVVSYDGGTDEVDFQFVQSGNCGCGSSGATNAMFLTYDWITWPDTFQSASVTGTTLTQREYALSGFTSWPTTPDRTRLFDMLLLPTGTSDTSTYVLQSVLVAGDAPTGATSAAWVDAREYNSIRGVSTRYSPSSITQYTPAVAGSSAPGLTVSSSMGYTTEYVYDGENAGSVKVGNDGSRVETTATTYVNDGQRTRRHLIEEFESNRIATPVSSADVEKVRYEYGYENTYSSELDWRVTIVEREFATENGPSVSATEVKYWDFFDNKGQTIVSIDPDKIVTRYEYDANTGTISKVTRNYDPSSVSSIPEITLPSGAASPLYNVSSNSDGTLVTEYERDLLGRVTKTTRPGGVESWTMFGLDTDGERPGIQYFVTQILPHEVSTDTPAGPIRRHFADAASNNTRSDSWAFSGSGYDPDSWEYGDATLGTELSRSVLVHDSSGQMTSSEVWWNIASDRSYTTTYEYDAFGRTGRVTDGTGTITRTQFDVMDRPIKVWIGTSDPETLTAAPSTGDMQTVAEYFYDDDPATGPSHGGIGNGNLTHISLNDGVNTRITRMYYDNRDRLIGTVYEDAPMSLSRFDNLDRVIETATYPEPGTIPSLANMITASGSGLPHDGQTALGQSATLPRSWYTMTAYSQRGYVYRERTAITPASSGTEFLESHYWYDDDGNVLGSWSPNSPGVVNEYDAHDRLILTSLTDRSDDAGSALESAARYTKATTVATDVGMGQGDVVIEETAYRYASSGVLDLVTHRMRSHDASIVGPLTDGNRITTYMGYIYDGALRRVGTVDFGTNQSAFNTTAASAPTLTSYDTLPELRSATDVLFSWTEYGTRGLPQAYVTIQDGTSATDEIRTVYVYDDMSRTSGVIENYDDASITWDDMNTEYAVTGLSSSEPDTDRVTVFEYDAAGNVVRRIAHLPGSESQETQYVYGTAAGSSSNDTDSLVASNRLLKQVRYPDESSGAANSGSSYIVTYAYNTLGELRAVTDQNSTIRLFERDQQGRVTDDIVDAVGLYSVAGSTRYVDSSVRRLQYAYDSVGRLTNAISYSDTSGTSVRDEVEITYTPLWQVATIAQQYDDEVDGSSPVVEYQYDNEPPGSTVNEYAAGNFSRLTGVVYPTDSGNTNPTVGYVYDTGTDSQISRVTKLQVDDLYPSTTGMADLVAYSRIGMSMPAKVTVAPSTAAFQPTLDRTLQADGTQLASGETYPGYDRFGRVILHMWVRDDFANGGTGYPSTPPILAVSHAYDRSSNPTLADDARVGARLPFRDRDYSYDRLHRLTEELRSQTAGGSYSVQHTSQKWDLDMLGNWDTLTRDADADGSYADNEGTNYSQTRTHNMANEIESNGVSGTNPNYDQRFLSTTAPNNRYAQHRYDYAGNMTDQRTNTSVPISGALMPGLRMTYDAWNRLITTEHGSGNGDSTTKDVSVYTYNALGWRTSKTFDASTGAYDDVMEQKRVFVYDASWRMVEEHIDIDFNSSVGTDWISQQFWGLRYIDDAVAKRVDRDHDGDWTDSESTVWYQLTDRQFSVSAVLNQHMYVYERVEYDAYGNARHRYGGDVNGDGRYFPTSDLSVLGGTASIDGTGSGTYHADWDVNLDGTSDYAISGADNDDLDYIVAMGLASEATLPDGWISNPSDADGPDNSIGYCGYIYNPDREDYTVRFRIYSSLAGRWRQRDPLGYVLGFSSLSQYVGSLPTRLVDPSGLQPEFIKNINRLQNEQDNVDPNSGAWDMDDFVRHYYRRLDLYNRRPMNDRFMPGAPINLDDVGRGDWYRDQPTTQERMKKCRDHAKRMKEDLDSDPCPWGRSNFEEHKLNVSGKDFEDKNVGFVMGGHRFKCTVRCTKPAGGKAKCKIDYEVRDRFSDPADITNTFERDFEPGGNPYDIYLDWSEDYP